MSFNETPTRLFNFNGLPPSEGLSAAWNLSSISDSFDANNLTNVGVVTFVAGKINNCANFTGANYLTIADNVSLSMGVGKKFSACGWLKIPALPGVGVIFGLLGKWLNPANFEYLIDITETGELRFLVSSTGAAGGIIILGTGAGVISPNVWYFFTAWYDGIKLYMELNNSGSFYSTPFVADIFDGTAPFRIGNDGDSTRFMVGQIDAVRLYKSDTRVLSAAERSMLYNNGSGREYVTNTILLADEVNREFDQLINIVNGITKDEVFSITPTEPINPALLINQNGAGPISQFYINDVLKVSVQNSGQIKSLVPTGIAPFTSIFSNYIPNLNVDLLDGLEATDYLQITSYLSLCDSVFFDGTPSVGDRKFIPLSSNTLISLKIQQRGTASSDATLLITIKQDSTFEPIIDTIVLAGNTQAVSNKDITDVILTVDRVIAEITSIGGVTPHSDITVSFITKQVPF